MDEAGEEVTEESNVPDGDGAVDGESAAESTEEQAESKT